MARKGRIVVDVVVEVAVDVVDIDTMGVAFATRLTEWLSKVALKATPALPATMWIAWCNVDVGNLERLSAVSATTSIETVAGNLSSYEASQISCLIDSEINSYMIS